MGAGFNKSIWETAESLRFYLNFTTRLSLSLILTFEIPDIRLTGIKGQKLLKDFSISTELSI